jgi:uncharacterized tellurite resistance protein B-like protein
MKELSYKQRIAILRILRDIILADNKVDTREQNFYEKTVEQLGLDSQVQQEVEQQNSLLALAEISKLSPAQKHEFAKLMGQMIVADRNINYNEVRIYNVVNRSCDININFQMNDYPDFSTNSSFCPKPALVYDDTDGDDNYYWEEDTVSSDDSQKPSELPF